MSDKKLDLKASLSNLTERLAKLKSYALPIFLVFIAMIYGFLFLQINSLVGSTPSDSDIDSQVKAAHVPVIDQELVDQLMSLKDNSVNVQALFEQARNNPFQ